MSQNFSQIFKAFNISIQVFRHFYLVKIFPNIVQLHKLFVWKINLHQIFNYANLGGGGLKPPILGQGYNADAQTLMDGR